MSNAPDPRPPQRWRRWFAAWAALTAAGSVLHHILWTAQAGGAGTLTNTPLLESAGNCIHMLIAPGWVLLRYISRSWPTGSWEGPVTANAIGWAFWLVGVWILLTLRRAAKRGLAAPGRAAEPEVSRRRFLVDAPLAVAVVGGAGGMVKGEFLDPWDLQVRRYTVPIQDLPAGLDGLRLVQISDTHLGPRIPAAFIREAVAQACALKPDLFCLTGDYIHNGEAFIAPAAELFRPVLATGKPVVGVLGNHDWYGDGKTTSRALDQIGVRMVDNGHVYLHADRTVHYGEAPSDALCIVGLGDMLTDWVDAAAAFAGVPEAVPRLVLAHNPDTADVVSGHAPYWRVGSYAKGFRPCRPSPRMDLVLSGHTHGGQVRLPLLGTPLVPSRFGQRYAGGIVQGGGFTLCISRGVGMSLLPVRFGVPPELVEITLTRA
jgi:predicted MPP superfamily phosphohydrolase